MYVNELPVRVQAVLYHTWLCSLACRGIVQRADGDVTLGI